MCDYVELAAHRSRKLFESILGILSGYIGIDAVSLGVEEDQAWDILDPVYTLILIEEYLRPQDSLALRFVAEGSIVIVHAYAYDLQSLPAVGDVVCSELSHLFSARRTP